LTELAIETTKLGTYPSIERLKRALLLFPWVEVNA